MADKKNKNENVVFVGSLERFGYTLFGVGRTKTEVVTAIMKTYDEAYRRANGADCDPRKQRLFRGDQSDYTKAKGDIYVREMQFGDVEWI